MFVCIYNTLTVSFKLWGHTCTCVWYFYGILKNTCTGIPSTRYMYMYYIFDNFIQIALSKSIRKCYFPGKNSDASAVLHAELPSFEENPYSMILLVFQTIFMQSKSNWADGSLLVQRSTPEKCEYARHVNILMYIDIICVIPSLY